jgi:hypothetical protein
MAMDNKKTQFALSGFRAMRLNPDGTIPTASRFLGFAGTVDVSSLTLSAGSLTIKIDGTVETKTVDFSGAVSSSAVTVAEAVTALTTAAFTGITWSADSATGRLKGVSSSGDYVQVYNAVAPLLDFGQSLSFGGQGLVFIKCFDNSKSYTVAKSLKDKEEIESESADGTLNTMVLGARLKGADISITQRDEDFDLVELIEGGTYDRTNNTYDPLTSDNSEHPTFFMEFYAPKYTSGTKKLPDVSSYRKLLVRSCQGITGDESADTKTWVEYPFSINATEYTDESSVSWPPYQISTMTVAAFEALNVETV